MNLPAVIENALQRPGMYVQSTTFHCVASFVSGYDAAMEGGFIVGFREWLVVRADGANNLAWPGLVLHVLGDPDGKGSADRLIQGLYKLLKEYWAVREQFDGLRLIYAQYEAWIRTQDWYTPESPSWLPDLKSTGVTTARKRRSTRRSGRTVR